MSRGLSQEAWLAREVARRKHSHTHSRPRSAHARSGANCFHLLMQAFEAQS